MHLLERPDEGHFLINLERKEDGKNPPMPGLEPMVSWVWGVGSPTVLILKKISLSFYIVFFKTKIYYKIWQYYQGPKMDYINTKHSRDKFTKAL